jgi:hypothetical protein
MNPEHERWAEALLIERQHGEEAPLVLADRVRALALEGDEAGVLRWLDVASRYDRLRDATAGRH